jgi:hypothetical protein
MMYMCAAPIAYKDVQAVHSVIWWDLITSSCASAGKIVSKPLKYDNPIVMLILGDSRYRTSCNRTGQYPPPVPDPRLQALLLSHPILVSALSLDCGVLSLHDLAFITMLLAAEAVRP